MKIFVGFILLALSFHACSQRLTEEELSSRRMAQTVVDKYLGDLVQNKNYIVFSSGDDQFLILVENEDSYHEYYIDKSNGMDQVIRRDTIIEANNDLFTKMFESTSYRRDYISFRSDFYKDGYEISSGNITYFALVTSDGTRLGESRLSMFVKPTPMDAKIYLYFVERLLANAGKS